VLPRNAVEIEHLGAFQLDLVDEPGRGRAGIGAERGRLPWHDPQGSARFGRPMLWLMAPPAEGTTFTIAHLSDLHCGGQYFVPGLLERAISEINDLNPDIVVCSGDLTTFGFKHEYEEAKRYLDKGACAAMARVPRS